MTEAKRARFRAAFPMGGDAGVGANVEAYVAAYVSLPWGSRYIRKYLDDIDALGRLEREVLLMRLANELEEYLDLGILYQGDDRRRAMNRAHGDGRLLITISEQLGFPILGACLDEAFAAAAETDLGPGRRGSEAPNQSFLVAPLSYQRIVDGLAARLRGAAGAQPSPEIPVPGSPRPAVGSQ